MQVLERLNVEQRDLVSLCQHEWISKAFKNKEAIIDGYQAYIYWMYAKAHLLKPKVIELPSPMKAQSYAVKKCRMTVHTVIREHINTLRDQVWTTIKKKFPQQKEFASRIGPSALIPTSPGNFITEGATRQVGRVETLSTTQYPSYATLEGDLMNFLDRMLTQRIAPMIEAESRLQVSGNRNNGVPFGHWGTIKSFPFVSFYDAAVRLGMRPNPDFDNLINLANCNIFSMIQQNELCIVYPPPVEATLDDNNRLHNIEGYAIKWEDEEGIYCVNGIIFNKRLWEKVISPDTRATDVVNITNVEQRMAAMRIFGMEKLLRDLDSTLVDKSPRGNELHLLLRGFRRPQYVLKYACPSTGRIYVQGVPNGHIEEHMAQGNKRLADRAMAWKFFLTLEEYDTLKVEA